MKMGRASNAKWSTFWSTLAREFLHPNQLPSWPLSTSAAPQTFLHIVATYSHWNSKSRHSLSYFFLLLIFLTLCRIKALIAMTLERPHQIDLQLLRRQLCVKCFGMLCCVI